VAVSSPPAAIANSLWRCAAKRNGNVKSAKCQISKVRNSDNSLRTMPSITATATNKDGSHLDLELATAATAGNQQQRAKARGSGASMKTTTTATTTRGKA